MTQKTKTWLSSNILGIIITLLLAIIGWSLREQNQLVMQRIDQCQLKNDCQDEKLFSIEANVADHIRQLEGLDNRASFFQSKLEDHESKINANENSIILLKTRIK